jgi:hypothetical protein
MIAPSCGADDDANLMSGKMFWPSARPLASMICDPHGLARGGHCRF